MFVSNNIFNFWQLQKIVCLEKNIQICQGIMDKLLSQKPNWWPIHKLESERKKLRSEIQAKYSLSEYACMMAIKCGTGFFARINKGWPSQKNSIWDIIRVLYTDDFDLFLMIDFSQLS